MGKVGVQVVKPGLSIQSPVVRDLNETPQALRSLIVSLKPVFFLVTFLSTDHWILSTALARDCGTHGVLYSIEEEDPIQLIQQKLKVMEESGELERHNHILQKKGKAAVERPRPVAGITRAPKSHTFYYDPTYVVQNDLTDHKGRVFIKKGTKVNPLETVSLSQNLLFFDGDDEEQKNFAKEKLQQSPLKLILTKGAPLALSEELKVPVYFDQQGVLTKKLGIQHVPALVSQEELRLRIEEIYSPQFFSVKAEETPESQKKLTEISNIKGSQK